MMTFPAYDVLLSGDGSGTTLGNPCGWHVTAHLKKTDTEIEFFGGSSSGTNNYAELYPYVHALWHLETLMRKAGGRPPGRTIQVVIVTDSEVTARCGSGRYERKSNLALWASVDWFSNNGYELTWLHNPRNSTPAGTRADKMAGRVRKTMKEIDTK